MSIDNATPDEWDRASRAISEWLQNERGVKHPSEFHTNLNQGGVNNSMMTIEKFQQGAGRTAKRADFAFDLTHAALGLTSEAGEFADAVKKAIVYGKPLDKENLLEELGDLLWFTSFACDVLNVDMADVMLQNLEKLRKRYPEKYSDFDAIYRRDKVLSGC